MHRGVEPAAWPAAGSWGCRPAALPTVFHLMRGPCMEGRAGRWPVAGSWGAGRRPALPTRIPDAWPMHGGSAAAGCRVLGLPASAGTQMRVTCCVAHAGVEPAAGRLAGPGAAGQRSALPRGCAARAGCRCAHASSTPPPAVATPCQSSDSFSGRYSEADNSRRAPTPALQVASAHAGEPRPRCSPRPATRPAAQTPIPSATSSAETSSRHGRGAGTSAAPSSRQARRPTAGEQGDAMGGAGQDSQAPARSGVPACRSWRLGQGPRRRGDVVHNVTE